MTARTVVEEGKAIIATAAWDGSATDGRLTCGSTGCSSTRSSGGSPSAAGRDVGSLTVSKRGSSPAEIAGGPLQGNA